MEACGTLDDSMVTLAPLDLHAEFAQNMPALSPICKVNSADGGEEGETGQALDYELSYDYEEGQQSHHPHPDGEYEPDAPPTPAFVRSFRHGNKRLQNIILHAREADDARQRREQTLKEDIEKIELDGAVQRDLYEREQNQVRITAFVHGQRTECGPVTTDR